MNTPYNLSISQIIQQNEAISQSGNPNPNFDGFGDVGGDEEPESTLQRNL